MNILIVYKKTRIRKLRHLKKRISILAFYFFKMLRQLDEYLCVLVKITISKKVKIISVQLGALDKKE